MDACPQVEWPAADWPEERAAGSEALDAYLFPGVDWNDKERRGIRTDGIVIVRHGRIVYERYDHGYTPTSRHIAWSVTKTVVGTLTGMAVKEDAVALDQSVCMHVQGLPEASCAVTVQNLLEFASGFVWRETYEGHPPTTSSVLAMLSGEGQSDMVRFVGSLPLRDPPGTTFMYSSGDTMLLSGVLDAALEPTHGKDFARTMLFEPLGMSSAIFERDGSGTYVGASYLFATPRDLARFGTLWLHDGCWNGERLLPDGWVRDSLRPSAPFLQKALDWHPDGPAPGRQIWLNVRTPGASELPWPSAPPDTFAALGHWSQGVYVVPSEDLVIVRTGDDRDATFSNDELLRRALAFARELAVIFLLWACVAGSEKDPEKYSAALLTLATSFAAQEGCSCRFVMERDQAFCEDWIRVSPDVASITVDEQAKSVTSRALMGWKRTARFVPGEGCRLDPK